MFEELGNNATTSVAVFATASIKRDLAIGWICKYGRKFIFAFYDIRYTKSVLEIEIKQINTKINSKLKNLLMERLNKLKQTFWKIRQK